VSIYKKLKTFSSLSGRIKWLLFKAIIISAIVKITLVFRPFKKVLNWLGKINIESDKTSNPESIIIRTDIKTTMMLCNKYTFWKTECYTQALTCKLLLKKYNLPSTLYIGFYKDEVGNYKGHAWLRSYDMILVGGSELDMFTVQSFFT
jgi:hypothetical protein